MDLPRDRRFDHRHTAYAWLLRVAPISLVVTHQYVNPLVAIVLGVVLLAGAAGPLALLGSLLIIGAVYVAIRAETPRQARAPRGRRRSRVPSRSRPRSVCRRARREPVDMTTIMLTRSSRHSSCSESSWSSRSSGSR